MTASGVTRDEPRPTTTDRAGRALVGALLPRLRGGRLTIVEGRSTATHGDGGEDGLTATVHIRDAGAWRAVLRGGNGLGEAYAAGLWDSDDLVEVLRLLARNVGGYNRLVRDRLSRVAAIAASLDRFRRPSARQDRRNIRAHYDLGDDFFRLFLDPTMAYSCALFDRPGMTLEEASTAKFERLCRLLDLDAASHVIEIGTGWGGFAVHAAREHGCRVTTTTISERQHAHASRLVQREGLQDRVTVLHDHYRDLRGTYTHAVSVEMIEAVDWRLYDEYFSTIARLLRPEGRAALQAITVDDREFDAAKRARDFIKRNIFPGGCLPSVQAMLASTARATDLSLVELRDIGAHYVPTLRLWREALDNRWAEARRLGHDERFLRLWRFYLAYCEAGFAERRVSDVQLVLARPGWRGATPGDADGAAGDADGTAGGAGGTAGGTGGTRPGSVAAGREPTSAPPDQADAPETMAPATPSTTPVLSSH